MRTDRSGPLSELRVVELAGIGPGPAAGRMLADLGAEVVRVERPGQPRDAGWPVVLRGRQSVILDLKNPAGRDALLHLSDKADVLIEPYRPGVAERLGVGPDICLARNPTLIYGRITGWGQAGPWATCAGHDIDYIAVTGALDAIGRASGPPQPPLNLLGDYGGGTMFLLLGILAALWERARSGLGQVIDAAIVDGVAALASSVYGMRATGVWSDQRGSNDLDTGAPYYDVYETADGKWMAVGAIEPQFWIEFVNLLGVDDLPDRDDRANWTELRNRICARFRERTRAAWESTFDGTNACVAPVLDWNEAARHPHNAARGFIIEVDGVLQPAPAPRFSRTPGSVPFSARPAGTDTRAVLAKWGVPDIDQIVACGATGDSLNLEAEPIRREV